MARLDGAPELCVSVEGGAEYDFAHRGIRDGDRFDFGALTLEVRHTPGHTPEGISLLFTDRAAPDEPGKLLTGDTLFVGDNLIEVRPRARLPVPAPKCLSKGTSPCRAAPRASSPSPMPRTARAFLRSGAGSGLLKGLSVVNLH